MMKTIILPAFALLFVSVLPTIAAPAPDRPHCPIIFDGRVASGTPLSDFDTPSSPFNPDYVKGENLTWSDILLEPAGPPSRFDGPNYIPVEVTICDESIFVPSPGEVQSGFRRAGHLFKADTNTNSSDSSVETLHWSVRQDSQRSLNLTHEYMNVWHETADYSTNQFSFLAGQLLDGGSASDKDTFKILGRANNIIWSTPIDTSHWQNFAVTLDYQAK